MFYEVITFRGVVKMEKNDNGFGTIRQRKNGLWEARLQIGTLPNGKPDRVSVYGKTELEVKRKLRKLIREGKEETAARRKKQSLEEYITTWLQTFKKIELKASSYDRLENTVMQHIIPANGNIQMHALTALDIQRHINEMQEKGYSYSTIKKVYDGYNACLKQAAYEGIQKAKELVESALAQTKDNIVILPKFAPWKMVLVPSDAEFVVYPSLRGGYSAQVVPTGLDTKEAKCDFPEGWAGKTADEL